ncbi:MAG: hypothetical protein JWR61_2270 [Ferruginibacter sp.]|nr:hypothetical protein [Ferruginibacter sp.]
MYYYLVYLPNCQAGIYNLKRVYTKGRYNGLGEERGF